MTPQWYDYINERDMMMYEIGDTVYWIKSSHDELPVIKEWVVAEMPREYDSFSNYVYIVPPDQGERKPHMLWRSNCFPKRHVTPDKATATRWLLNDIDQRIEGFEADIETLRDYRIKVE